MGINTRNELAEANRIIRKNFLTELMTSGVTVVDPAVTYIDPTTSVGADSVIHPNVTITGASSVGRDCEIGFGCHIVDCELANGVTVHPYCVMEKAKVETGAIIGPFARLRPGAQIGKAAHIGNYVEIKKSTVGTGSKINHLTYIGDAQIGKDVNIGAGTITCNYDGVNKHRTVIEDGAFIGSDSQMVAPVTVGKNAYVGSGSTITKDVPADALAVARGRQVVRENWSKKKHK